MIENLFEHILDKEYHHLFNNFPAQARKFAIEAHASTNHLYDGYLPYEFHLRLAVAKAEQFIHILPADVRNLVLAAVWLHDTIEDARVSYNDIIEMAERAIGLRGVKAVRERIVYVADLVFAVTNNTGKTRNERADAAYYAKIRKTPYGSFVKLSDRLGNAEYGRLFGGKMRKCYQDEHEDFVSKVINIHGAEYEDPMIAELELILDVPVTR